MPLFDESGEPVFDPQKLADFSDKIMRPSKETSKGIFGQPPYSDHLYSRCRWAQ